MAGLDHQTILQIFNARHACKKFDGTKSVSDSDFQTILEAARLSPSSFGFEPWHFLVLQNQTERQKQLRQQMQEFVWGGQHALENASHFVVILARKKMDLTPQSAYLKDLMQRVHQMDEEAVQMRMRYFDHFASNEWGFLQDEAQTFNWAARQCYIALGNMMTVAASLGIDSYAIEGFHLAKANAFLTQNQLMAAEHFGVAVMLGIGYRGEEPKHTKTRTPINEVVEFL